MTKSVKRYNSCISLGWYCGIASTLTELGLRSHSGPFDWMISDYRAVLEVVENGFIDYMSRENLVVTDSINGLPTFCDVKYGFLCPHDIKNSFDDEYKTIYQKYSRRVEEFKKRIKESTVLFRAIHSEEEIAYINENWERAEELFKSFNKLNRIIYLYSEGMSGITQNVESYVIRKPAYGRSIRQRHLFESNSNLMQVCNSLLDERIIQKNKEFDRQTHYHGEIARYINRCVNENVEGIDNIILENLCATKDSGIYIWGAGKFGRSLAVYLENRGVLLNGFIDNGLYGEKINDYKVCSWDNIDEGAKIFIAVSDKDANMSICNQIMNTKKDSTVARYGDLCDKLVLV